MKNKRIFKCLSYFLCFLMSIEPCFAVNFSKSNEPRNKEPKTIIAMLAGLLSIAGIAGGIGGGLLYKRHKKNQGSNTTNLETPLLNNNRDVAPNQSQNILDQNKDEDVNSIGSPLGNSKVIVPNQSQNNTLDQNEDVNSIGNALISAINDENKELVEIYLPQLYNIRSVNIIEWIYKAVTESVDLEGNNDLFCIEENEIPKILWGKFEQWLQSNLSLYMVCEDGHYPPLLEKAVEIDSDSSWGNNAIFNAVWKERINLKIPDEEIGKALIMSINKGNKIILKTILEEYPNLKISDEQIGEALSIISKKDIEKQQKEERLKIILEKFSNLKISADRIVKILKESNIRSDADGKILEIIWEKYPDLKIPDTCIDWALPGIICTNKKGMFEAIWEDLKVSIRDEQIERALSISCLYNNTEVFETIWELAKSKNLNILDKQIGKSLIKDVIEYSYSKTGIFNILLTEIKNMPNLDLKNKYINDAFVWSIKSCADLKGIINPLFANGADINLKDEEGNTLLNIALINNHCSIDTIKFLVKNGVNVNARNYRGYTAMDFARNLPDSNNDKNDIISYLTGVAAF